MGGEVIPPCFRPAQEERPVPRPRHLGDRLEQGTVVGRSVRATLQGTEPVLHAGEKGVDPQRLEGESISVGKLLKGSNPGLVKCSWAIPVEAEDAQDFPSGPQQEGGVGAWLRRDGLVVNPFLSRLRDQVAL